MRRRGLSIVEVLSHFGVPLDGTADGSCVRPVGIRRTQKNGYWSVSWGGRNTNLHRIILEWKLGEAQPTGTLACHSCGHKWCVNPGHVRADTAAGNMADQYVHGHRVMGERHPQCRLSDVDAAAIRSSAEPTSVIASRHGIAPGYVNDIRAGRRRVLSATPDRNQTQGEPHHEDTH